MPANSYQRHGFMEGARDNAAGTLIPNGFSQRHPGLVHCAASPALRSPMQPPMVNYGILTTGPEWVRGLPSETAAFLSIAKRAMSASGLPQCPQCASQFTYQDGSLYICPECAHEWSNDAPAQETEQKRVVRDAVGNELQDGDAVTVIKDLKVKGSSLVVKMGTKVKNIRLVEGDHDIDCKIDGIGAMQLKSEFVKKA